VAAAPPLDALEAAAFLTRAARGPWGSPIRNRLAKTGRRSRRSRRFGRATGNRVVVAFSWKDKADRRHEWAEVLELADGKIIAMQDYAKPASAALVTRLRTVLP